MTGIEPEVEGPIRPGTKVESPLATAVRKFDTGATRDQDTTKYDYEGFISPIVTQRFGEYMHSHRKQRDGQLRAADNWQKGIPLPAYISSLVRHVEDLRLHHDGYGELATESLEDSLCAIMFNVNGYMFELLKQRYAKNVTTP